MPLPSSARQLLEQSSVHYKFTQFGEQDESLDLLSQQLTSGTLLVRSQLLIDGEAKLHIFLPSDELLDLSLINRGLGKNYRGCTQEELETVLKRSGMSRLPSIPGLIKSDILIAETLLCRDSLYLEAGEVNSFIEVSKKDFAKLCEGLPKGIVSQTTQPYLDDESASQAADQEQIRSAVSNFTSLRIKKRLEETIEIPPLPDTAQKIIKLRVDPNADMTQLSNVVEKDPSLAAQVVSWAASPYYGAPGEIKSVNDAIIRVLGFDLVINLALGLALGKALEAPEDCPDGLTPFWHQSVFCAATVGNLVSKIPIDYRPRMGVAYLAGLLHNFGMLVMAHVFPPHFSTICRYIEVNPGVPPYLLERHLLGISREQIGAWLLGVWNMPEEVTYSIRHQNIPAYEGDHHIFSKLIYLANTGLHNYQAGICLKHGVSDELLSQSYLNEEQYTEALVSVINSKEELQQIATCLG